MVALRLGKRADFIGEIQRLDKIGEGKHAFQAVNAIHVHDMPGWHLWAKLGYLGLCHRRLTFAASDTLHLMKLFHDEAPCS